MKKWEEVREDEPGRAVVAATFSWLDAASHPDVIGNLEEIVIREFVTAVRIVSLEAKRVVIEEVPLGGVAVWPEDLEDLLGAAWVSQRVRRREITREALFAPSERKGYFCNRRGPLVWNVPCHITDGEWYGVVRENRPPDRVGRELGELRARFLEHLGVPAGVWFGKQNIETLFARAELEVAEQAG